MLQWRGRRRSTAPLLPRSSRPFPAGRRQHAQACPAVLDADPAPPARRRCPGGAAQRHRARMARLRPDRHGSRKPGTDFGAHRGLGSGDAFPGRSHQQRAGNPTRHGSLGRPHPSGRRGCKEPHRGFVRGGHRRNRPAVGAPGRGAARRTGQHRSLGRPLREGSHHQEYRHPGSVRGSQDPGIRPGFHNHRGGRSQRRLLHGVARPKPCRGHRSHRLDRGGFPPGRRPGVLPPPPPFATPDPGPRARRDQHPRTRPSGRASRRGRRRDRHFRRWPHHGFQCRGEAVAGHAGRLGDSRLSHSGGHRLGAVARPVAAQGPHPTLCARRRSRGNRRGRPGLGCQRPQGAAPQRGSRLGGHAQGPHRAAAADTPARRRGHHVRRAPGPSATNSRTSSTRSPAS